MQMAYLEVKMLLFMILRNFRIELAPNHPPVTYRRAITLPVKGKLNMLIKRRK